MSLSTAVRPSLKPLATLESIPHLSLHKNTRSYSVSSSISTSSTSSPSSTCSRMAEDMLDRLASQEPHSTIDLWSAGNVRLNGRDLTMAARNAEDLFHAMKEDDRFIFVKLTFSDPEGEDWKISFRRSHVIISVVSDSE